MARCSVEGRTTNAPTATLPGASLYAIANVPLKVVEVGVFNTTATACMANLYRLGSAGTQGAGLTENAFDSDYTVLGTAFQSHTGSVPTLGTGIVRASLGAAVGAGMVWTFDAEPLRIAQGTGNGIGIMCLTGTGQILDFYFIWDE